MAWLGFPSPPIGKRVAQGNFGVLLGSVQGEGAPKGEGAAGRKLPTGEGADPAANHSSSLKPSLDHARDGEVAAVREQREQKSGFGLRLAGSGSRELPGRFSRQQGPALMGNWLWACLNRRSAAARPPRAGTLRSGSALGPHGEHGGRRGKAPSATGIGVSRASPGPARGRLVLAAVVPLMMMMIPLQMNLSYFHATKFPRCTAMVLRRGMLPEHLSPAQDSYFFLQLVPVSL